MDKVQRKVMHKRILLYAILICAAIPCVRTDAIPTDPVPGINEQGKNRLAAEYLNIFRKRWLDSRDKVPATDIQPYNENTLAAARAERDRQVGLCRARIKEFGTEAAYVECLTLVHRDFARAIDLKDLGLIDAYLRALAAAAGDADTGKLTRDQAHGIYDALAEAYQSLFGYLFTAYDYQISERLAAQYRDRFTKSHQQMAPNRDVGQPPLDDDAEEAALDNLAKANKACDEASGAGKSEYAECILAAELKFSNAVKLRDNKLYSDYAKIVRAALSDRDAEQLTLAQFKIVVTTLSEELVNVVDQQQSEYRAVVSEPIVRGYSIRFLGNYFSIAGDTADNDHKPAFDTAAFDQAQRDENKAGNECASRRDTAAKEAEILSCYITAYRNFAAAIKLRDTLLLQAFISAMQATAADGDARRLPKWEMFRIYAELSRIYNAYYWREQDTYLIWAHQSLATQYVMRLDNDYLAAMASGDHQPDGPPWDEDTVQAAQIIERVATQRCFDRRAELITAVGFWDCRAEAERTFATSTHFRDVTLLETTLAATHQAAVDADAGKITADELSAIEPAIGRAFARLNEEAMRVWRSKKNSPEFLR